MFADNRTRVVLAALGVAALITLAACDDKEVDPPAELVDIVQTRSVQRLWTASFGGDSERLRLALRPIVVDGVVYVASHDGEVIALSADKGKRTWLVKTKLRAVRRTGSGGRPGRARLQRRRHHRARCQQRRERWRKSIGSEVLARPLIANDIDRDPHRRRPRRRTVACTDGAPRWAVDEQVPRLTLRGTAPPVLAGDRIIAGFDNGKVLAIDPRNGDVLWDAIVNAPHGRTELERLADIDAPARVVRRRHLRRRLPGSRCDARARFRADLVGARRLQLSRLHAWTTTTCTSPTPTAS